MKIVFYFLWYDYKEKNTIIFRSTLSLLACKKKDGSIVKKIKKEKIDMMEWSVRVRVITHDKIFVSSQ